MVRSFSFPAGWVAIGLALLVVSCSAPPAQPSASSPAPALPSQSLPITAEAQIGKVTIGLEVARTPEQQQIGLMNRTSLADDRGMLFAFDPPRVTQFWMRNTLIPLDMVFLRQGVVQVIVPTAAPCKADPCPIYGSSTAEIDQVIELRGGRAQELNLKVGDRVPVKFLTGGSVKKI